MRDLLISGVAGAALLFAAAMAPAQSRFIERGYPNVTDAYQSGLDVYSRTWSDLNLAQKRAAPSAGDWYRFDLARGRMEMLQRTWRDGSFDHSQLNDAITDLQFVLNFSRLSGRDRDALVQDLELLRDIRVRYGR
jgi:hypothetical protein